MVCALFEGIKNAVDLGGLHPVFSRVFFRPEEYGFSSERIDNTRVLQTREINEGHKYQGIGRPFDIPDLQFMAQQDSNRFSAMPAFRLDRDG